MKRRAIACLILALTGCDASAPLSIRPVDSNLAGLDAKLVPAATGGGLIAFDPATMPTRLTEAKMLHLAFGPSSIPLVLTSKGYTATLPSTAKLGQDVEGRLPMPFVVDQSRVLVLDVKLNPVASL